MANFRKIAERILPHEVVIVKINPSMDIIALALASSDIAINRLYSWQRVWSIPKPKHAENSSGAIKVIDMVWSIDGKILAVAYDQPILQDDNDNEKSSDTFMKKSQPKTCLSSIAFYLIETNSKVYVHNLPYKITCLCWQVKSHFINDNGDDSGNNLKPIDIDELKLPLDTLNVPFVNMFICDDEILEYPFNTASSKNNYSKMFDCHNYAKKFSSNLPPISQYCSMNDFDFYDKMNLLQRKTTDLIVIGTKENIVLFYMFGYFQLLEIDVKKFLQNKLVDNNYEIDHVWMSPDLGCLQLFIKHSTNYEYSDLFIFETRFISTFWKEIYLINRIRLNCQIRLEFLKDSLTEIHSVWSDIIVDIESRLSNYEIVSQTPSNNSDSNDTNNQSRNKLKPQEFIDMLIFGNISLNLEHFLHDVSKKEINKLFNAFENCINEINRLIITRVLNTLAQLVCHLDNLRGMILNDFQFGNFGFQMEEINDYRREIAWMMDKCNKFMLKLSDLKSEMLAFTRLIYKGVYMVNCSNNERNEAENSKLIEDHGIGKMTLQDFHLVMGFLNSNSFSNGFKFDMVGKLLKRSVLSPINLQTIKKDKKKNPYNSHIEQVDIREFLKFLNQNDQKIYSSGLSEQEYRQITSERINRNFKFENIKPSDDQFDPIEWFQQLMDDRSNIDIVDETVINEFSLFDHLSRINHIDSTMFKRCYEHQSELQTKLIELSTNNMALPFMIQPSSSSHEMPIPKVATPTVSLDCQNILDYQTNPYLTQSGFLFVSNYCTPFVNKNQSTVQLLRIGQPLDADKIMESVEFRLVSKCYQSCQCNVVSYQVEKCQFYDCNLLTMIVTEKHPNSEENPSAIRFGTLESTRKQYLIQFKFKEMFDLMPQLVKPVDRNHHHPQNPITFKSDSEDISGMIDLSVHIEKIHNYEQQQSSSERMQVDEENNSIVETIFKLRWLDMISQQKFLSVSSDRKLACCRDKGKFRITTFEMDSFEDDDDDEGEEEGGEMENEKEDCGNVVDDNNQNGDDESNQIDMVAQEEGNNIEPVVARIVEMNSKADDQNVALRRREKNFVRRKISKLLDEDETDNM